MVIRTTPLLLPCVDQLCCTGWGCYSEKRAAGGLQLEGGAGQGTGWGMTGRQGWATWQVLEPSLLGAALLLVPTGPRDLGGLSRMQRVSARAGYKWRHWHPVFPGLLRAQHFQGAPGISTSERTGRRLKEEDGRNANARVALQRPEEPGTAHSRGG